VGASWRTPGPGLVQDQPESMLRSRMAVCSARLGAIIPTPPQSRRPVLLGLALALFVCVATTSPLPASASQDGVIAFQRNDHIFTISPTGADLRSIGPPASSELDPGNQGAGFSPDGQSIIFAAATRVNTGASGSGIFTIGADGSGLTTILSSAGGSSDGPPTFAFNTPSYFPNGQEIVFSAVEGFGSEYRIYTMNLDGSNRRQLTSGHEDYESHVSPDGTQIAFDRVQNGHSTIYIMSSAGSVPTRLSARGCDASQGGFSPDGSELVFVQACGSNSASLFTMAPDGSHRRRLTRSRPGRFDTNPAFSPDGQSIAFLRRSGHRQPRLYTMKANGSRIRRIADGAGAPTWQPVP
jgi:Tol biopolymer transport system component